MRKYTLLLIDVDNTLLDFHADAKKALHRTWNSLNLQPVSNLYSLYEKYNHKLWRKLERGEISIKDIKKERFKDLSEDLNLQEDPVEMNRLYEEYLSQEATLMNHVHSTMNYLKEKYILISASNGISRVQRGRLRTSSLQDYFEHCILSEDIGVSKPDPQFFVRGLKDYSEIDKEHILMIGDSLTSDILGAKHFGIDSCWVNTEKKERPQDLSAVYEINAFSEVQNFL